MAKVDRTGVTSGSKNQGSRWALPNPLDGFPCSAAALARLVGRLARSIVRLLAGPHPDRRRARPAPDRPRGCAVGMGCLIAWSAPFVALFVRDSRWVDDRRRRLQAGSIGKYSDENGRRRRYQSSPASAAARCSCALTGYSEGAGDKGMCGAENDRKTRDCRLFQNCWVIFENHLDGLGVGDLYHGPSTASPRTLRRALTRLHLNLMVRLAR